MVNKNFWRNRKVLVTGHTGFKGSWLMEILLYLGAKPYGLALNPIGSPSLFEDLKLRKRVNHNYADIRDLDKIQTVIKRIDPEVLIHMAAQPLVIESYKKPIETLTTNIIGTANILSSCTDIDNLECIISVTTDKVYSKSRKFRAFREEDPLGGDDPYSCSKACVELVTKSYFKSFFTGKINIATARAGNVIGGGDWASNRLIPDFIRSVINNKPLTIRSPDAIRPWQHVLEPLFGYLLLAERICQNDATNEYGAWNFGPNKNQIENVVEIARIFSGFFNEPPEIIIDNNKKFPESENLLLDSEKSNLLLNWNPKFNFYETLEFTYDWYNCYLNNGDLNLKTHQQIEHYISKG